MNDFWFPMLPFAVFFAWLLFSGMRRRTCPDCNKPLSPIQSPFTKTWRQWIEGGYVCRNCGCEADIAGDKIPAGTAPQRRSIIIGFALLTLAVMSAIVLIAMLFRRP